jgi:hypothetical protein
MVRSVIYPSDRHLVHMMPFAQPPGSHPRMDRMRLSGATLGATGANDVLEFRTKMNTGGDRA